MKIEVKLFSYLCSLLGKEGNHFSFNIEMEKSTTCVDLLKTLNLPAHLPIVILVNGAVKGKSYVLQEGDKVSILPPVEGG